MERNDWVRCSYVVALEKDGRSGCPVMQGEWRKGGEDMIGLHLLSRPLIWDRCGC